jgi:uncharacterized membrane protein
MSPVSTPHENRWPRRIRTASRWFIGLFFIVSGMNHFRAPAIYIGMIPPWLPWPASLNLISGACEILGGIGILLPPVRILAGWGLIALLIAVFPANLHVALMGHMPGFSFSPLTLWLRLPFQAVLIAWVAWVSIWDERPPRRQASPGQQAASKQGK